MATTTSRSRRKAAPQTAQPAATTPDVLSAGWSPKARQATPRPTDERVYLAELVRGLNFVLSYGDGRLHFTKGKRVPICESEFQRLRDIADPTSYPGVDDDDNKVVFTRQRRKFCFYNAESGEPVVLDDLPELRSDEVVPPDPTAELDDGRDRWRTA